MGQPRQRSKNNNNNMMMNESMTDHSSSENQDSSSPQQQQQQDLYYFAYGPVVNDLVRKRRGIHVDEIQAAYLPDYRLTFAIGGMANIVPRRGYEVHGLLMRLTSQEDWETLIKFDAGSAPSNHRVIPYKYEDYGERREGDPREEKEPLVARFVEFSEKVEDEFLDSPIETLPQCRYLELIAKGMNQYGVDEDYIDTQIMAIPFVPKRPPEEYQQVPMDFKLLQHNMLGSVVPNKLMMRMSITSGGNGGAGAAGSSGGGGGGGGRRRRHSTMSSPTLPQISYGKYQKLCQKNQPPPPSKTNGGSLGFDVYFIVNDFVYRIHQVDISAKPAAKWFYINGHGKPDCSLLLHKLIVDPDIPLCDHLEEMTSLHFAWVENRIVEQVMEKYQCQVTKVATIKPSANTTTTDATAGITGAIINDDSSSEHCNQLRNHNNHKHNNNDGGGHPHHPTSAFSLKSVVHRTSKRFSLTKRRESTHT